MQGADTAWILTSTALVLFMTLPGLALFYAGLVRSQNVLSVLMNCFAIAATVSILWFAVGYSIAFGDGNAWWGGLGKSFLSGVGIDSVSGTIPETLFFMFQMTFAIITPALIVGAYPERIHFSFVIAFSLVWVLIVYAPVVHWVWGGGFLAEMGLLDFAGGVVVHVTAGVSALVLAMMLGPRRGFPNEVQPPHNPGLTMIGAAMLWVGWFGFNAGSALAADAAAGMAMTVTHISAAAGAIAWSVMEIIRYRKASLVGAVTGMVAGLATITPASGSVGPIGGLVLGLAGGVICYMVTQAVKQRFKIDDSLDVFGVHGIGGFLGTCMLGIVASPVFGGFNTDTTMMTQTIIQCTAAVATAVYTAVASYACLMLTKAITGGSLRVPEGAEQGEGLDMWCHGEACYSLSEGESAGGQPVPKVGV